MTFTRRKVLGLTVAGASLGLMPRLSFADSIGDVILGVSAPITGNQAQYGQDIKAGVELAAQQLNESKQVPGANFKIVVEDSKGDPQEAANVAQKFASRGDVMAVVGDFSSTACLAAAPIYQRSGIIMITPTASHPDITKTGDYIFRNTPIASSEAGAVVDWGTKDLGFKKVAIIGR
ncbi:MAG: ABC transporter substrate-binding protein, partial [Hyphomicrobiales bacterium]|nr:ABC transporter substrate-binding protein [Hyphomicrobiales bacterium]